MGPMTLRPNPPKRADSNAKTNQMTMAAGMVATAHLIIRTTMDQNGILMSTTTTSRSCMTDSSRMAISLVTGFKWICLVEGNYACVTQRPSRLDRGNAPCLPSQPPSQEIADGPGELIGALFLGPMFAAFHDVQLAVGDFFAGRDGALYGHGPIVAAVHQQRRVGDAFQPAEQVREIGRAHV